MSTTQETKKRRERKKEKALFSILPVVIRIVSKLVFRNFPLYHPFKCPIKFDLEIVPRQMIKFNKVLPRLGNDSKY